MISILLYYLLIISLIHIKKKIIFFVGKSGNMWE